MKISKWFGFGRGGSSKRRVTKSQSGLRPVLERLEERSLLTVIVDDGTPCAGGYTAEYNSINSPGSNPIQAANDAKGLVPGDASIQVCGGTYEGNVNVASVGFLFGMPVGKVTIDGALTVSNSGMAIEIDDGDTPGTDYSQLVVNGFDSDNNGSKDDGIILDNVSLNLFGTRQTGDSQAIVLIQNNSDVPVSGTFAGMDENAIVDFNDGQYFITYKYDAGTGTPGTGNDVALVPVPPPPPPPPPPTSTAVLTTDPLNGNTNPANKALYVYGSSGNDTIMIAPAGHKTFDVQINGLTVGTVDTKTTNVTHIIVYAGAGDDSVNLNGALLTMPAIVFGEGGNDTLDSAGGPTVLVGGEGDDKLIGRKATDILIGGMGSDTITGHQGNDILIGGTTAYDTDVETLAYLLTLPVAGDAGRLDMEDYLIDHGQVTDDGVKDTMNGNAGNDVYFASLLDKIQLKAGDTKVSVS